MSDKPEPLGKVRGRAEEYVNTRLEIPDVQRRTLLGWITKDIHEAEDALREEMERELERKGPCEHPARMWEKVEDGEPFCRVCKEMWNVNQALADEGKKKSDDCPHPRRCTRWDVKTSRFLCDVCQAVKEAVEKEREANCKAVCRFCRGELEGVDPNPRYKEGYVHNCGITTGFIHEGPRQVGRMCDAADIRRRREEGK